MPFFRSLLILLALVSPALSQDGPRDAAAAREAAQALQLYLDGVLKSGGRPDYTNPPASDLFGRVFDTAALAALPPPGSSDLSWLLAWSGVANQTYKLSVLFGAKPGPNLDQAALRRNLTEYEDQCAAAMNFILRIQAREATALTLFMNQLKPEQRTPARDAGLQQARSGGAETIVGAIASVAQGMKPANARLMTAAMRDTRDVWAAYILPNDRTQIVAMLTAILKTAKDDEMQKNLAAFAAALSAAK